MKLLIMAIGVLLNSSLVFAQDIDITTCMSDSTKAHYSTTSDRTYLDIIDASGKITDSYVRKFHSVKAIDSETISLIQNFLQKEINLKTKITEGLYYYSTGLRRPTTDTMLVVVDSDQNTYLLHDYDDNDFEEFGSIASCEK